jgi:hypothetical protein
LTSILGSFVDIKIETDLDPYMLFWQYLLWIKTDCTMIKFLIIMDICTMLNIVDLVWEVLRFLMKQTFKAGAFLLTAGGDEAFEAYYADKPEEEIPKTPISEKVQEEKTEGFLSTLYKGISEESPNIMTAVIVAILAYFGIKPMFKGNVDLKKYATILSATSLAIGVIPKIYTGLLKIITFVIDHCKSLIDKEHQTEKALLKEVHEFLETSVYIPGVSEPIFMEDPPYAITFLEKHLQMRKLDEKIHKIQYPPLITLFKSRMREMNKLLPAARAGLSMSMIDHEIIHFQFTSKPGAGKTDLNHTIALQLHTQFQDLINETLVKHGLSDVPIMKREYSFYPANDNLSYEDNLYEQFLSISDEENVMNEQDGQIITSKLMEASGAPMISNQASLEGKGRIRPIRVKISNTNTPFNAPKGMLKPEALWRRRNLFEVRVASRFLTPDGKIDPEKITAEDRAQSKHLEFRWLEETSPAMILKDEAAKAGYEWITISSLKKLIAILTRRHFITEEKRLISKNPRMNYLRLRIIALTEKMRNASIFSTPKSALASEIAEIIKYAQNNRSSNDINISVKPHFFEYVTEELKKLFENVDLTPENVTNFLRSAHCSDNCKHDEVCAQRLKKYGNDLVELLILNDSLKLAVNYTPEQVEALKKAVNEEIQPTAYLDEIEEICNQKLTYSTENGGCIYLSPTTQSIALEKGFINYSKVSLEKIKIKDAVVERVIYRGELDVDESVLAYNLHYLSNTDSREEFELRLKQLKIKSKQEKLVLSTREHLQALKINIINVVRKAYNFLYNFIFNFIPKFVFTAMASAIGVFLMFAAIGCFMSMMNDKEVQPTIAYNDGKQRALRNPNNITPTSKTIEGIKQHDHIYGGVLPIGALKTTSDGLISKSSWLTGNALCIEGNVYLTNFHFISRVTQDHDIYINDLSTDAVDHAASVKRVSIDLNYYHIPDTDCALFVIKDFRSMKNLKKHFVTEANLKNPKIEFGNAAGKIVMLKRNFRDAQDNPEKELCFTRVQTSWYPISIGGEITMVGNYKQMRTIVMDSGEYKTIPGNSGLPILHDNTTIDKKILGITVGIKEGTFGNTIYGGVVTQDQLNEGLKHFPIADKVIPTICNEVSYASHPMVQAGVFKYPDRVYKSPIEDQSISRSPGFALTGKFTEFISSFPAIQSPKDPRNINGTRHFLAVSLNKANGDKVPFINPVEEEFMIKRILKSLKVGWNWQSASIYTPEEAIRGVKKPGSRPINLDGCAGIPYKLQKGMRGKRPLIEWSEDEQQIVIQGSVINNVQNKVLLLSKGRDTGYFKLEFRKKELVGENKIINPKTRTVGLGNMDDQIVYDMACKDIHTGLKSPWRRGLANSYVLGFDPERHADLLIEHLKHKNYLCLDVVAWEEKMTIQLMRLVITAKIRLLEEAHRSRGEPFDSKHWYTVLMALVISFMDCHVVFEDLLIRRVSGLLSGWPGTQPDNSGVHKGLIDLIFKRFLDRKVLEYKAFREITSSWPDHLIKKSIEENNIMPLRSYDGNYLDRNISAIVAADDVVIAVSDHLARYFTPKDLADGYADLSYEITAPDKSDNFKWSSLEEVEFLKHKFRREGSKVIAYPMEKVIYQLLTYYRTESKLPPLMQIRVNIQNAMRFAFFHGREFYEDLRSRINDAYSSDNYAFLIDYDGMRMQIEDDHKFQDAEYEGLKPTFIASDEEYEDF